jgi:hypothetical protein
VFKTSELQAFVQRLLLRKEHLANRIRFYPQTYLLSLFIMVRLTEPIAITVLCIPPPTYLHLWTETNPGFETSWSVHNTNDGHV